MSVGEEEAWDLSSESHSIPRVRRVPIGLAALISTAYFGFVGAVVVYADLVGRLGGGLAVWALLGTALLGISVCMMLVWLRLWFGPRAWLDRMLSRMLLRSSGALLTMTALILVCAALILWVGR